MNFRKERLESLIADLLSKEIVKNFENPEVLITVSGVEINDKLEKAVVKISVFPDNFKDDVLNVLRKKSRYFQGFLLRKIAIKSIPEIDFNLS